MGGESRTLSTQVSGVYRRLADARPRKADHVRGSEPVGMPDSDDDVGFGMAPPRTSGSTKHRDILRVMEGMMNRRN